MQRVNVGPDGIQANNHCRYPVISPGGQFVVFGSKASNLYPNDKNHSVDVLLHDRQSAETVPISQTPPAP